MAIDQTIDTKLMAQRFADAVREMPAALDLYYQQYRGVAEFWLVTSPIDVQTQMEFYGASQLLYDQFPEVPIDFHVINPSHFIRVRPLDDPPEGFRRALSIRTLHANETTVAGSS